MSWYTIEEQCDYCAHRWIAVMDEATMQAIIQTGPTCPSCGIQNDPRQYNDVDLRPPLARAL